MKKAAPQAPLSEAQREIMEIVWERGEVTAADVRQLVPRDVARNTVSTLLVRMEEKGWLAHRAKGRTHVYSAAVPRETTVTQRVMEVVDKVCGGSSETLVAALLDHGSLTIKELDRIRVLVNEAKRKRGASTK